MKKQTFNYFNPKRYLLSQNWKNAIQSLINAQDVLSGIVMQIKPDINPGLISMRIESLQFMIRKIGQRLKEPTNKELKEEVLVDLAKDLSTFINDPLPGGEGTKFGEMLEAYGMDEYQISQVTKRLLDFVHQALDAIQLGSEEKFDIRNILNSPLTQTLFSGAQALSPAVNAAVFGGFAPAASIFGNAAVNLADKMGMNKYFKELAPFKKNLTAQGQQAQKGTASATGGFAGAPGGSGIGMPNFNGNENFASTSGGGSGVNDLYTFFNKGAFQAAWTKKVLTALGDVGSSKGDKKEGGLGSFFSNLPGMFKGAFAKVASMLPMILGPALAAVGGWFLGRMIGSLKIGNKTVDQHTQSFFEKNVFKSIAKDNAKANQINASPETIAKMELIRQGVDPKEAYKQTYAKFHPEAVLNSSLATMNTNLEKYHENVAKVLKEDKNKIHFSKGNSKRSIEDPMMDYINMGLMSNGK
jgi:hypothetical protein